MEKKYFDRNNEEVINGSVINIHQTVNGQNIFVVLFSDNGLHVVYGHDLTRSYEYDKEELLKPSIFSGESDFEIIGNVYFELDDMTK